METPPDKVLRIGCDATIDMNARNHLGSFVEGGAFRAQFCSSIPFMEALAIWRGLRLVHHFSQDRIIVDDQQLSPSLTPTAIRSMDISFRQFGHSHRECQFSFCK